MRANRTMPRLLKKHDGFLLLLILIPALVSAGLLWNQNTAGSRAVIRINGEIVSVLPLSAEGSYPFENNGIHLTVTLHNSTAAVTQWDCPDGLCGKAGTLHKSGQTAVCLPAAFSLSVAGEDAGPDGITY